MTPDSLEVVAAVTLGVIVSLVAGALVALRINARGRFDLVDLFLLGVGFIYGIGYAFVIHMTSAGLNPLTSGRIAGYESSFWVVPALALGCLLAGCAYTALCLKVPTAADESSMPALLVEEDDWIVPGLAWAFLAISVASWLLYSQAYGGVFAFFEVADALRSGLFDEAGENFWSFLRPFGGFSIFASYLFAAHALSESARGRLWSVVGLIFAATVATLTLLGWLARVDILVYWAILMSGALIYRMGLAPRLLASMAAIGLVAVVLMPALTEAIMPGKSAQSAGEFFAKELSFPVESSLNSLDVDTYHYGVDVAVTPLFLLPERIWNGVFELRAVSDRNSQKMHGDVLRQGFGFTIPSDFITIGLHQFGLIGPLLLTLFWCTTLARFDTFLVTRLPRPLSAFLYSHAVLVIAGLTTPYAEPRIVVNRNFHFIVGLIALVSLAWLAAHLRRRSVDARPRWMGPDRADRPT